MDAKFMKEADERRLNFMKSCGISISNDELNEDVWRKFYNNYLKADYVGDDANTYQFKGNAGTIFNDISTSSFDDGTHHSWNVAYPDRLGTYGGSVACMTYVLGTADTAAIQYQGTYKLVNMGFPFETIVTEEARDNVMRDILNFFNFNTAVENWELCY